MRNFTLLIAVMILITVSCKDNSTKNQDQTPVSNKELDELATDATFNDVVTIFEKLDQNPDYNSLLKLANQANMMGDLQALEDVTFFAPNNDAIKDLSDKEYADLRNPNNREELQNILKYHIVKGERDGAALISSIRANSGKPLRLQTIQGGYIALQLNNGNITITDENASISTVVAADIETSNGVIHGVNKILNPTLRKKL